MSRGPWCPALPLPLATVTEMGEGSDSFQTMSTHAGGTTSECQDEGSSDESAPEWTPRDHPQRGQAGAAASCKYPESLRNSYGSDHEVPPPWAQTFECNSAKIDDTHESAGFSRPSVPPISRMPQQFNVFTPRPPGLSPNGKVHGSNGSSPGYLDSFLEYAHNSPRKVSFPSGNSPAKGLSSSGALRNPQGIPYGLPVASRPAESPGSERARSAGRTAKGSNQGLESARRELAEAHVELLARAADLRRREKRVSRLEQRGGADKENVGSSNATPSETSLDSVRKCVSAPLGAHSPSRRYAQEGAGQGSGPLPSRSRTSRSVPRERERVEMMSPREQLANRMLPRRACDRDISPSRRERTLRETPRSDVPTPRDSREVRSRRSVPAAASSCTVDDETRRIRKEIRLERRLRRRAEQAATSIWRNALLIAGAVSLCVAGVTALSVALAIRH